MYTVIEIEDAILATLKASALNTYVKDFFPVPSLDEKTVSTILKRSPSIGVMAGNGTYGPEMSGKQDETGIFAIMAFNKNLRSPSASLRGGGSGEPGCWDMIDDARNVLKNSKLGLEIIDCHPVSRAYLFSGKDGAACALEIEVKWRHSA